VLVVSQNLSTTTQVTHQSINSIAPFKAEWKASKLALFSTDQI